MGSTIINTCRAVLIGIQVSVLGSMTVCSAEKIFGNVLPLAGIYSCSSGNGGASRSRLIGFLMIGTVVPSSSSTDPFHGRIDSTCMSQNSQPGMTDAAS